MPDEEKERRHHDHQNVEKMMSITWARAAAGFVESNCERWRIVPVYSGRVRPKTFELRLDGEPVGGQFHSQREAKRYAADAPPASPEES